MSEFNPSVAKQKLPGAIEAILEAHKKALESCDFVDDMAKQSGAKQFIDDAAAYRQTLESLNDLAQRLCGKEGDTLTEDGTMYAAYEAAKKLDIATGGAD